MGTLRVSRNDQAYTSDKVVTRLGESRASDPLKVHRGLSKRFLMLAETPPGVVGQSVHLDIFQGRGASAVLS